MRISLLLLCFGALVACSTPDTQTAKPPALESEHSDMPWNTPQPGEGGGALGGILNQR